MIAIRDRASPTGKMGTGSWTTALTLALFLASDEAAYVNGHLLVVDAAITVRVVSTKREMNGLVSTIRNRAEEDDGSPPSPSSMPSARPIRLILGEAARRGSVSTVASRLRPASAPSVALGRRSTGAADQYHRCADRGAQLLVKLVRGPRRRSGSRCPAPIHDPGPRATSSTGGFGVGDVGPRDGLMALISIGPIMKLAGSRSRRPTTAPIRPQPISTA